MSSPPFAESQTQHQEMVVSVSEIGEERHTTLGDGGFCVWDWGGLKDFPYSGYILSVAVIVLEVISR